MAVTSAQVKTPVGSAPVIPLVLIGIGAYLAWFLGIHYFKRGTWPSAPIKSVLTGKGVPAPGAITASPDEQAVITAAEQQLTVQQGVTPGTGQSNPNAVGQAVASGAGSGGGTAQANQALGQLLAAGYGWTGAEWDYLRTGWEEESGWNQFAANVPSDPYDHAYGIPQANPGTKMASAGSDWKTSPHTQIEWGLAYIKATYGSPTGVPLWSANGPLPGYVGY